MNTSPAPDVDRVLHRMGRSAFDYRSFPNPIDDAAPLAPHAADTPEGPPPAGTFSLISEALPEAFTPDPAQFAPVPAPTPAPALAAASAPAPKPAPMPAPLPAPPVPASVSPVMAPAERFPLIEPLLPGPSATPAPAPPITPLSHMFRVLSGHAGPAPTWYDADRQEAGFPFRRR